MDKASKIYVAGHNGMVGSSVWRALDSRGYTNLIGKSSKELDLRNQNEVREFFKAEKPTVVIDAAARVGGILANDQYPYTFISENLQIQNNLIDTSLNEGVEKFVFLGSSCIYPKMADQPLKEEYLLTGPLEPTNQWYAIAKIAGVKTCEAIRKQYQKYFVSLMPTNLYGPHDNFDLKTSHVLPAMIRKFHEAKSNGNSPVKLWGSGRPMREFLHVDDLARAVLFSIENELSETLYNVGTGTDLSIMELAKLIQEITGHEGTIEWDSKKPDGTPRKLMDVSKMKAEGWSPLISLDEGIQSTYEWFLENQDSYKRISI
jgi:GDP-L-fucose synthase